MVQIANTSSLFLVFLKSLKIKQSISSYYSKNTEMVVEDIDLGKGKVSLRQSNLPKNSAKWFGESDFVNGRVLV